MPSSLIQREPIAVIGIGCRFPGGASSPSKLWDLLSHPRDVLSKIPPARFNPDGFYHPDASQSGHSNVRHAYILSEDHRTWDADFFGVSAQEAVAIDPQQRLLMECVYEALEDGGQRIHDLRGSDTAVFVGMMSEEYSGIQTRELSTTPKYLPTGTARSVASNRISYFFDWRGASMTIDTACSSSLVCLHQAVQTLRLGESRIGLVAGTNLILSPEPFITESTFRMLSPTGRSHMWADIGDEAGYGRGDGIAAVVLKKLSDAVVDGDRIACIVRETGVNQDGRTNGITVPSAEAQTALIENTYRRANLDLDVAADRPQFFEAHGTGTLAGDPIEAEAIHRSIGRRLGSNNKTKLFVGSVKTVIGHTEGTAGLAGLIKACLAIQHGVVPPNLLFNRLNPAINPFYGGLEVPVRAVPWPDTGNQPRRASINSFGFGGTNAHAIVESYPSQGHRHIPTSTTPTVKPPQASCAVPYTFSAATKASLKLLLQEFVDYLEDNPGVDARDLAFTLNVRRSILPCRVAYTGRSVNDLKETINAAACDPDWESKVSSFWEPSARSPRILGIFTGQGAQWAGMGKQLIENLPFAKARLWELESALATLPRVEDRPRWSLTAELLGTDVANSMLNQAEFAQPLCTALQIVLVDLLEAANVRFSAVVGHSSGEIAAAYAAGVLSASDAIVIAYYRGVCSSLAWSQSGQDGGMLAVGTTSDDAEEIVSLLQFEGRLDVAAHNSPKSITLSGDADAIKEAEVMFQDEGKFARIIRVDKAYHSSHMQPCLTSYVDALRRSSIQAAKPRKGCKWHSSVFKGSVITGEAEEELDGAYWSRNMAQTVLFSEAIEDAILSADNPFDIAVEVGPHGALRGPFWEILASLGKPTVPHVSCLSRSVPSDETFGKALGQLWAHSPPGALDLDNFQITAHNLSSGGTRHLLASLPKYPWDNRRVFWHESRRSRALRSRPYPGHPLLGTLIPESTLSDITWHHVLRVSDLWWLTGHQLQGQVVFPAAAYATLALEAISHAVSTMEAPSSLRQIVLENLSIGKALVLEKGSQGIEALFSLHIQHPKERNGNQEISGSFTFNTAIGDGIDTEMRARGKFKVLVEEKERGVAPPWQPALLPAQEEPPALMVDVNETEFYSTLNELGYQYSSPFRALSIMKHKLGHGRAIFTVPRNSDMHTTEKQLLIHPGLLDASFQAIFLAYSWPGDGRLRSLHVPVSIEKILIDVATCRALNDEHLRIESDIVMDGSVTGQPGIRGDANIFTGDGGRGIIQTEGIRLIPFGVRTESQDTQLFFTNVYGVAFPDGELATSGDHARATAEDTELGWLLERISHFYLRRLTNEITEAEEANTAWHYRKLMDFARRVTRRASQGTQPYSKKEWIHDTPQTMKMLMDAHNDNIDVRLMRSVGEHLGEAIRGESIILQHMLENGMLNQYYVQSLGMQQYTVFLARVVGQIAHVNPHLRILEIGGGTGAATRSILSQIQGAFEHWVFTDISSGFFELAEGIFSAHAAAAGRVSFEVLNIEEDVVEQGFEEYSYDLVVASLVLHATKDLQQTLCNVHRLLKPGGFLVMLEIISNEPTRLSFTMGGLEGWWLGAETGRPWSPCVSSAEWHELLLRSEFSGVETSTPELDTLSRPFGVLVSRAMDERTKLLLTPSLEASPFSGIPELVIVAGHSLNTVRLAQTMACILRPHCTSITIVTQGVEGLVRLTDGTTPISIIYLGDLDRPVFEGLTQAAFDGLKKMFACAEDILWVTSGARRQRPYARMPLGLCRAVMMEEPNIHVQFVDCVIDTYPGARAIADDILRLSIMRRMGQRALDKLAWSREPEITIDSDGRRWVPRIMPHTRFNNCYNSSHRVITSEADPSKEILEFRNGGDDDIGDRMGLVRIGDADDCHPFHFKNGNNELVRVRSLYSASFTLNPRSSEGLYVHIGISLKTQETVIALSSALRSVFDTPESCTMPYSHSIDEAPTLLASIARHLLADNICHESYRDVCTLLVEPSQALAETVTKLAGHHSSNITCVTTSLATQSSQFTYVPPNASQSAIRSRLPLDFEEIIVFPDATAQASSLVRRLQASHPRRVAIHIADLLPVGDRYPTPVKSIQDIYRDVSLDLSLRAEVVSAQKLTSEQRPRGMAIIDWRTEKLSLTVRPSDALPLLRADRTYLLVGLAGKGGIGSSLAEYLARQGARHIILTSRNPHVDVKLISGHAKQGVRMQAIANDITDGDSLRELIADVRSSGSWPPIAGVANGAMVLEDVALQNMSYDQMMRVIQPKVDGTNTLDDIFHDDELDFFVLFSSLSCVYGRQGQSNYGVANMYMVGLAAQRRSRGVCASVIDIGAIVGAGYIAREKDERLLSQLLVSGYRKMSERDLHITFANGVLAGRLQSEDSELLSGLFVAPSSESEEFTSGWAHNPRFSHIRPRAPTMNHSVANPSHTQSVKELLERAETHHDVSRVIEFAVFRKIVALLQLDSELAKDLDLLAHRRTSALGVDSLVAVELRSWMLHELDVDVPVLKILNDSTIREVANFAIERVMDARLSSLNPHAKDTIALAELATSTSKGQVVQPTEAANSSPPVMTSEAPSLLSTRNTDIETSSLSSSKTSDGIPPSSSTPSTPPSLQPTYAGSCSHVSTDKTVPMSYSQSRFWLMSHVVDDPTVCNVTCNIEINAEVDVAILSQAVRSLGTRHEALRTRFVTGSGHQPMQMIMKESTLYLETCSGTDDDVERLFTDMHKTLYDLEEGRLMRMGLISKSTTRHNLLVGYHHINMDSGSLTRLVHDLQKLYHGESLPALRVQYPDFTTRQLERLRNGSWDEQVLFWKRELSLPPDPIPILDISPSSNRQRPESIAYKVNSKKMRLKASRAKEIKVLCRRVEVSPFHVYTTILRILISRLTTASEFCIGMAYSDRSDYGADDCVGNFLNLLPIRLTAARNESFESLLKNTKDKILLGMLNSSVPFDIILEESRPARSSAHGPLFQVFIDYRQVTEKIPWGEGVLEGKQYSLSKIPYDIMLDIIDTPTGEASLEMTVQDGLYTSDDVARILGCYANILDAAGENSQLGADELIVFNRHEVQAALRLGQGELMELKHPTILPTIDEIAATQPLEVALEDGIGNSICWSQMVSKTKAIAQTLAELNIPAHSRIGVLQEPTVDWIVSMLGIWRSGNVYVPLELSQGLKRLGDITKSAHIAVLLVHDATANMAPQLGATDSIPLINVSHLRPPEGLVESELPSIDLNDEAMVMFTSGSTGVPKGISIAHRVVVNAVHGMLQRWPMSPQTVLQQIAISFDLSWWGAILGLVTKGKVVVVGREERGNPQALADLIVAKNATLTVAVPSEVSAWLQCGSLPGLRTSKWSWHIAAGEPFTASLLRHFRALDNPSLRVINAYGPTETMIPTANEVLYRTAAANDTSVPIGKVMANYTARVVDQQGRPVPSGVPGQLVFGGAGIAHGYVDDPRQTAERFPQDTLAGPIALGQGWDKVHMSGDRGFWRETDGSLVFLGRIEGDTQIKLRGLRINLLEVEASIVSAGQNQISEVAVHLRKPEKDDTSSHFLVAHVVLTGSAASQYSSRAKLDEFLRQLVRDLPLPDYMRPAAVASVVSLPHTQHGKLDRKALSSLPLREEIVDAGSSTDVLDASTNISGAWTTDQLHYRTMRELWSRIIGDVNNGQSLQPNSDFFTVGGNSLLLIKLQGEIKKYYNLDVKLSTMFQCSTLSKMARLMEGAMDQATAPEVDWEVETKLQPELVHIRVGQPSSLYDTGVVVVLTGASGFLGRQILTRLIARSDVRRVYCVAVRYPEALADQPSSKVVVCPGNLSLPRLGMDEITTQEVFSAADIIIHNGADTSFLKAYHTVRDTNLGSTKEIVRLALHYGRVRQLHFVSTAGVSTLMGKDLFEEPLRAHPPKYATEGYVLSKWASELYLENVGAATSLPITIHRPTAIIGAGAPALDVVSNLLQFSERLQAVPSMEALEGTFQFVDIDTVAQDMVSAVASRQNAGAVPTSVQYCNHGGEPSDAVPVHELGAYLGQKLDVTGLPVLPDAEWVAKGEASGMAPEVASYLLSMNLNVRKGKKWVLPMVRKGVNAGT